MAKKFATVFGWIFVILGILGFFSNPVIGEAPGAWLMAGTAHNVVHLITGVIFLWVPYGSPMKSAGMLKLFGVIYLLVAIIGFFSSTGSILGLFMVNGADNWLHLVLGIIFLWGGMSKSSSAMNMGGGM